MKSHDLNHLHQFSRINWVATFLLSGVLLSMPLTVHAQSDHVSEHHHGSVSQKPHSSLGIQGLAPMSNHAQHHMEAVTSDESFLRGMIPHHQEAVDTSAVILTRTNNPQLAKFAQEVIATQSQEITQMKQWYAHTQGKPYQLNTHYAPMMPDMKALQTETLQADKLYMQGMIEHHQGAIEMAQQILKITQNPKISKMAHHIIEAQSAEVTLLQTWLNDLK